MDISHFLYKITESNPYTYTTSEARLHLSNYIRAISPWTLTAVSHAVHGSVTQPYASNSVGNEHFVAWMHATKITDKATFKMVSQGSNQYIRCQASS